MARRRRIAILVGVGLAIVLLVGTYFGLRTTADGPDLGDKIASILNKRMRGRVEIGSVEWPADAVKKVVTGGWVPIVLRDVRVWDDCALSSVTTADPDELRTGDPNDDCTPDDRPDPDPHSKRRPRRLLIRTDRVTADIDIHALAFGNHDFVFRNLVVHGGEALIEQTTEPYPLHAYDRQIVSIVTAFYPRMSAGFRAGIYADQPPPIFDLRDIHIEDLNLTIHVGPDEHDDGSITYAFAARVEGVNMDVGTEPRRDSYLYMDAVDPLVAKFYVHIALTGKRAHVRVFDKGPRAAFHIPAPGESWVGPGRDAMYELELVDLDLQRLAQVPTEWPRKDYVANTLEVDLRAHTLPCKDDDHPERAPDPKDGADVRLSGQVQNYWDRPYDGSWDLALDAKNLGPTIHTCIKKKVSGDHVDGRITLSGPFVALPKIGLDLKNVDVDVPLDARQEPLKLTLAEVHGSIDLVNDTGKIEKTRALVKSSGKEPPGELDVAALFALAPYSASATVDIVKPIEVSRFLPARLAAATGGKLLGHLHAAGDVDVGFALDELDLSLGPTVADRAVRVHKGRLFTNDDFDTIDIDHVAFDAGQSHASVYGSVDTVHGELHHVTIDGEFPDLDVWLARLGLPPIAKKAGDGKIVIDGRLDDPTVSIDTVLSGVPCIDKLTVHGQAHGDVIDIPRLATDGFGGPLQGSARIRIGGAVPVLEKLHLEGTKLAVAKMCGLAGTASGTLDRAEIDAHGSIDKSRPLPEWLALASVYATAGKLEVFGDAYSNVSVCLNRKDDTACRPRASHLDDDDLQECAAGKAGTGGFCAVVSATRDAGGRLDATIAKLPGAGAARGRVAQPAKLGGTIALEDVPASVLDRFAHTGTAGGFLSATLHLAGTPEAPQARGAIALLRGWALGGFIGDSVLEVAPATLANGAAGVSLKGSALAGRLAVNATLGTAAPYPVELGIDAHRVEVDPFLDVAALLRSPDPVSAWASGKVTIHTLLSPPPGKSAQTDAWLELSELQATVAHHSTDGRLIPLTIAAKPQAAGGAAVSIHVTPELIELACRDGHTPCNATLATPVGDIALAGHASFSEMNLTADGTFDLARLGGLLDTTFDDIRGKAVLHAALTGTLAHPTYEVGLDLTPKDPAKDTIQVRPVGSDTVVRVPGGKIRLANGELGFDGVAIDVEDDPSADQGRLTVRGTIGLDSSLTPESWALVVQGRVAGKLIGVLVPSMVSEATGAATIGPAQCPANPDGQVPDTCGALVLSGNGKLPDIAGTLSFAPPAGKKKVRPIAVIPRGVRRELAFVDGGVDITTASSGDHRTYTVEIGRQTGAVITIDREGRLTDIAGTLEMRDGSPTKANVTFDATNIPLKVPDGTLDLTLSARGVTIGLDGGRLRVGCDGAQSDESCGAISVINGAFKRNYELTDAIVPVAPVRPAAKPFWEEYPALGAAELDLYVDVAKFSVKNNIANPVDLSGAIRVSGTPREPRLDGEIRVDRGEFRIPGTRARFTRTTGAVRFQPTAAADDPQLELSSDADFRDLNGQDHVITLTITGTLGKPLWDLRTSTGYDKSQTLALLVLGQNPDQLRRSLGDQSIGSNPTVVDPTTSPSATAADQVVKDLAGDAVTGLLGSSLTKLLPVDVLRFELGFGAIGVHAERKLLRNINVLGDAELTTLGRTLGISGVVTTPWLKALHWGMNNQFSFKGGYLSKLYNDPADAPLDVSDASISVVYKLFIP
nr:translocation/assembly module TamB domain-containing protein [Kofleriaceae bacterium]